MRDARCVRMKKLTLKELKEFKEMLLQERERVLKTLEHLEEKTSQNFRGRGKDTFGIPSDLAELGRENFEKDLELNLTSSESLLFSEIDEALTKIDRREYGKCEDCGCFIPIARLKALPFAKFCLACQEKREKKRLY